jgi:cytochrome c-type biogenesis protein CcmH/NrfG
MTSETPAKIAATDRQLLQQLGLGPGASNAEIETAHDEVVSFLEKAPGSLRAWAHGRISEVDEAYAILSGEVVASPATTVVEPLVVATPPAALPRSRAQGAAVRRGADVDRDWLDELDPDPAPEPVRRPRRGGQPTPSGRPNRLAGTAGPAVGGRSRVLRGALVVLAVAALGAGAIGVYALGAPAVPPISSIAPGASAAAGVDQTQVAADMQKLVANPNDLATLQDLANVYYAGQDYTTAQTWLQKILAIDPKNVAALLGSGAASFNLGDLKAAETAWRAVLAIDEKNVEAHYDLGFMYLSENPPDMAKVTAEWNTVIALAPDSDIAKTIATHLASLNGSPAPSAAPLSPTPSPVASPG